MAQRNDTGQENGVRHRKSSFSSFKNSINSFKIEQKILWVDNVSPEIKEEEKEVSEAWRPEMEIWEFIAYVDIPE